MIERAVFSYFNPEESFGNKAGFRYYSDFLYSMALATLLAKRNFKEVQIVTSTWGERVLKEAGIPATEYSVELDCMRDISKWFWAYGKLITYNLQTKPFIHVDNDVFIWHRLPWRILEAELCFQSKEQMNVLKYQWYDVLKPCWNKAVVRPEVIVKNEVTDYAYNCGICGGHNLEFFKEWIHCSAEYIFAPENQKLFFEDFKPMLIHQNLFHEQYFAASLIKSHDMRSRVQVIADSASDLVSATNNGYTHLWGSTKTGQNVMSVVKKRLLRESPELYDRVTSFVKYYLFKECPKDVAKAVVQ